jgi:hypothetical protein
MLPNLVHFAMRIAIATLAFIWLSGCGKQPVNAWEACCADGQCAKQMLYDDDDNNNGPLASCWVRTDGGSCGVCFEPGG